MIEWLKNRQDQIRQRAELEALSERELNDIDLSRGELLTLAAAPADVLDRQTAMARRFGIDAGNFNEHRHDMVAAVTACAHCEATDKCAGYLKSNHGPEAAMDFCPNGELYASLAPQRKV